MSSNLALTSTFFWILVPPEPGLANPLSPFRALIVFANGGDPALPIVGVSPESLLRFAESLSRYRRGHRSGVAGFELSQLACYGVSKAKLPASSASDRLAMGSYIVTVKMSIWILQRTPKKIQGDPLTTIRTFDVALILSIEPKILTVTRTGFKITLRRGEPQIATTHRSDRPFVLDHLAAAALLAIRFRCSGVSALALAFPPFRANSTAYSFLVFAMIYSMPIFCLHASIICSTNIDDMRTKRQDRDGVFMRRGAYYISFTDAQGRRRKRKLKGVTSLTTAKALRAKELENAEKARLLGYTPPTKDSFASFVPRYLKHQKPRLTPAAYERSRGIVEDRLKPQFGSMQLSLIRRRDVESYLTSRLTDVSVETARKEFFVLSHMLTLAVSWELIPANAALGIELPQAPAGRVRYLQPTELQAVLAACPGWLQPIAGLLAFTGMRRSEVLKLRWLDIDRKGERILLPQTKNGDGRTVWLNLLACDVIDSLKAGAPTDLLFPGIEPENVSLAFLRACRKIKIADFKLHDLRHTAASWLRMSGADLQDVADLLGHRDLRMTRRYAHLSPAHLSAAVKRLDGVFGQPLALAAQKTGDAAGTMEPQNSTKRRQTSASKKVA
jgi:integrase